MESIYAAKPWMKHYDKHVPEKLEHPTMAYADVLRKAFEEVPLRVAVHYMGTEIPCRKLDELSNQFAHFLIARGCRPGDPDSRSGDDQLQGRRQSHAGRPINVKIDTASPCLIMCAGGTTGAPKVIQFMTALPMSAVG